MPRQYNYNYTAHFTSESVGNNGSIYANNATTSNWYTISNDNNSYYSFTISKDFYNEKDAIDFLKEKGYIILKKKSDLMETE